MKSRIEELAELVAESKDCLDNIIDLIRNAETDEQYMRKFDEFDRELANYVKLRIEAHDLCSKN